MEHRRHGGMSPLRLGHKRHVFHLGLSLLGQLLWGKPVMFWAALWTGLRDKEPRLPTNSHVREQPQSSLQMTAAPGRWMCTSMDSASRWPSVAWGPWLPGKTSCTKDLEPRGWGMLLTEPVASPKDPDYCTHCHLPCHFLELWRSLGIGCPSMSWEARQVRVPRKGAKITQPDPSAWG